MREQLEAEDEWDEWFIINDWSVNRKLKWGDDSDKDSEHDNEVEDDQKKYQMTGRRKLIVRK